MEEFVNQSWSLFLHDHVAAFNLSERSPLPPALSAKDLSGARIEILNVRCIRRINRHSVESDEDWSPGRILDTKYWLSWNGSMDKTNDSEDDCVADIESNVEPKYGIKDRKCRGQWDMTAAPHVS
jgi:hypothetical protein